MSNTIKPMSPEEEYFARENAEKMRKLAADETARLAKNELEALKQLYWMRCPKCGFQLQSISFRGQTIERCGHCGVTVLDEGELEKVAQAEDKHGVMKSLMGLFSMNDKK